MRTDSILVKAIEKKDFALAKELLQQGETIPDTVDKYGLQYLYECIIKEKAFEVLDALVEKGKINTDVYELDSLHGSIYEMLFKWLPADEASLDYLKNFINKSDNINDEVENNTLLSYAMQSAANPAIIQTLIDAGLRTDFKNNAEENLISQAVQVNINQKEKQIAYLDILIKADVDVNETNVVKRNALHIAIDRDKKHLLDILLENGARPNEQDKDGTTAFHFAVAYKHDAEVYQKLAAYERPDFTLQNKDGQTMLSDFLQTMGGGGDNSIKLLEQLIDDGADLEQTARYYWSQKSGWDWIVERDVEFLKRMLEKTGMDVNKQDDNGNTLLHKTCAVDCNFTPEIAKRIYQKVKLLLELGADTNITNAKDETPFILASADNLKAKTAELLLKAKNS